MPAVDPLAANASGIESPALGFIVITPSDATDLTKVVRSIYVGVGGDVSLTDTTGVTAVHKNTSAGGYLGPFHVARVNATGTTATNLLGYI